MTDDIQAEWERLCERLETRLDLYDQTRTRHQREMALVSDDLAEARAARDRFGKAHPEASGLAAGEG